jgi:hypothetical protein
MLQAWLFFGFPESAFGVVKKRFPSSAYVCETSSGSEIRTSKLREIVVFCKLLKSEFEEEEELVSYLEHSKARLAEMNGI